MLVWVPRARARLSNEAFARFLGAIKELNAGRCSREQASPRLQRHSWTVPAHRAGAAAEACM